MEPHLSLDEILSRTKVSEEFVLDLKFMESLKNDYPKEETESETSDLDPDLVERLTRNAFYKPSTNVKEEEIKDIAEDFRKKRSVDDIITIIYLDKVSDPKIKERIVKLYRKDRDAQIRANKKHYREFQKTLKQNQYTLIKQQEEILKNEQNN